MVAAEPHGRLCHVVTRPMGLTKDRRKQGAG